MDKRWVATLLRFSLISLFLLSGVTTRSYARPIDVLLVIDGSGSMAWPDRDPEGLRIQGAKLFIDLCEIGDRIGIVDFSTDANIIFPLHEIRTFQDKLELKQRVDKIEAKGMFTDITLALQTSLKEMTRARDDVVKAVILLTDGEIDPDPSRNIFSPYNQDYLQEMRKAAGNRRRRAKIKEKYKHIVAPISREILRSEVLPDYRGQNIPVFTVAFGQGADVQLLREIAAYTITEKGMRNYYFVAKVGDLLPIFSEIVEQLKETREKIAEKKVEFVGEKTVHKISIDDFIREINFRFIFDRKVTPSEIQTSLRTPDGEVIDRTTEREGIGHILEEGYELYNIFSPLPGTWEAIIRGKEDVKLDITISTWGRTDLKILGVIEPEYSVGDSIPIIALLQDEGKRITSPGFLENLEFLSWIENPKGKIEKLKLYDDGHHADSSPGDGIYGNLFTNTSIPGDYIVRILAQGITTGVKRFNFTREAEYKIRVSPKERVVTPPVVGLQKVYWPRVLKIILIAIGGLVILLIAVVLIKRQQVPSFTDEELPPNPDEALAVSSITLKLKDGGTKVVGSKQIRHPSVGKRNLIIRRTGEEFSIYAEEGTLELNESVVTEEKNVGDGDILKIGELYYRVQLTPEESKITLSGITKE